MGTPAAGTEGMVLTALPDERPLLNRARSGDAGAFRQLVMRHQACVHALALGLTDDAAEAVQLSMAAFASLDGALVRIHGPSHLERSLLRAVVLPWLAHQRSRPSPSGALAGGPIVVLRELPAESRAAVLLHLQAGMDAADVAAVLVRPPGAVAGLLQHALEWLETQAGMDAAELRRQLRAQLMVADPGADFTARVMARRELRWSHRRSGGRRPARRAHRRWVGYGLATAVIVAGLVLAWRWPWPAQRRDAQVAVPVPAIAATPADEPAAAAPAPAPDAQPVVEAAPVMRDLYRRYTVIAMPPRAAGADEQGRAAVASFNAALLDELRRVPGLVLLVPGVTAAPSDTDRPADFLLTVASLEAGDDAGGAGFRLGGGGTGGLLAPLSGSLPGGVLTLGVESQRAGTNGARQWPVQIRIRPIGQPASASYTSAFQVGVEPIAQLAARQVSMLRMRVFPDATAKQQLLSRLRDGSLTEAERGRALSDLLATQLRNRGQGLDVAGIDAIIGQAALMDPGRLAQLWRSLRGIPHPALVDPLLESLRRDADAEVRYEALATLAANHGNEPRVRAAIETTAEGDADPVVRMAARRALDGDEAWHRLVVATLADRQLDDDSRLAPLLAAARSASTGDELRRMRALVADPAVMEPLAAMVREGWFDAARAAPVGDALELLANVENPPAFDLTVQLPRESAGPAVATASAVAPPAAVAPSPQLSPAQLAWLAAHRNDPRMRRILDGVARGEVDPQWPALIDRLQAMEQSGRGPWRR